MLNILNEIILKIGQLLVMGLLKMTKKGDHQLIVIIPNDFSQKVLDVDNRIADPSIINI
ncbi:hypothetical protein SDD34_07310 [Streptococcus agalactiae]|nr:hypothetical protein SDD34_07310 [Streptococcus agalactiae]